jgi:hypothetical protein
MNDSPMSLKINTWEQLVRTNPETACACGDPVSVHSAESAHWCLRWDCGCTRFTTPQEMELLLRSKRHQPPLQE